MRERSQVLLLLAAVLAGGAALPAQGEGRLSLEKLAPHPRLLAGPDRLSALSRQAGKDPLPGRWLGLLRREGRKILEARPCRYEIPDGLRLLGTSRRVLRRVQVLALLHRLGEGPGRVWLERAWRELLAASRFPDWNPRHFLDTAEMTAAFAVGYDWLYRDWTPLRRRTLERAIVEKGLRPALLAYRGKAAFGWWVRAPHNWNLVCNGGVALGALAVAEKAPAPAAEVLRGVLKSVPRALARMAPDGGWGEGPGYWGYANQYTTLLLCALETSLGKDFGLSRSPGMAETGLFPIYLQGPSGRTFNFADGGDRPVHGPAFFWYARRFRRPVYAWHEAGNPRPGPLDLLWYSPDRKDPAKAGLPLDKRFRGPEAAVFRSSWGDRDALFLAAKGGDNGVNHGHLDLGTFVLDALGVRWALDLGADDYNLPGYWNGGPRGRRWNYYRLRAEGHNTLVLNPGKGPDQDPRARAGAVLFRSRKDSGLLVLDLSRAYRPRAASVRRGFLFSRSPGGVLVQDEVAPGKTGPLQGYWFLHTRARVEVDQRGRRALLSRKGKRLEALLLEPAGARFQVLPAAPLPGSPDPPRQGRNQGVRKLAVSFQARGFLRLAVFLRPLRKGGSPPSPPGIRPLSAWR